jgi:hypothetical protein
MAILQSLLKTAKAIEAELPSRTSNDPVQSRRQKFIAAVQDQIALLDGSATKQAKRRRKQSNGEFKNVETQVKLKSWLTKDSTVLTPKYGGALLEFAQDKCALQVTPKTVEDVLKQLIAATQAGEMDPHLAKAAAARKRPQKKVKQAT